MKITRVKLFGLLGAPDAELSLGSQGAGPFVITGPSGAGKTRTLEAIIAAKEHLGAYGLAPRAERWRRSDDGRIEIDLLFDGVHEKTLQAGAVRGVFELGAGRPSEAAPVRVAHALSRWSREVGPSKVEYFHAGRLADCEGWSSAGPMDDLPSGRLTRARGKYSWVRSMLEQLSRASAARAIDTLAERGIALGVPSELDGFSRRLMKLTDRLKWLRVVEASEGARCIFARPGGEVELSDLSDGERAVVLFAAAFERLGLDQAIVLIDMPELMLHPEDHVRVVDGLASMLTDGQLIIATTSPAILRAVPASRICSLGR